MFRIRFQVNPDDPRPVNWPIKHPYWITGYAGDDSYATVVSYADDQQYILDNWPDATNLEIQEVEGYQFSDRFPKPEWFQSEDAYDCTEDVKAHILLVQKWVDDFIYVLKGRANVHDESKLKNLQEKAMFDRWTPELQKREFGGPEYQEALKQMGEGLKLHYAANEHHPEHFENGIDGMTLYNLIEMVCDWMAAAEKKGTPVDLDYLQKRFNMAPQLRSIIENTFHELDIMIISNNMPMTIFTKYAKGK